MEHSRCLYCSVKNREPICGRCAQVVQVAIALGKEPRSAIRKDLATTAGIEARVAIALRARGDAPPANESEVFLGFQD